MTLHIFVNLAKHSPLTLDCQIGEAVDAGEEHGYSQLKNVQTLFELNFVVTFFSVVLPLPVIVSLLLMEGSLILTLLNLNLKSHDSLHPKAEGAQGREGA